MDKKQAFKILLQNSRLLKEDGKSKLLAKVDSMSDAEIDSLGKFFAYEAEANLNSDSAKE